MLGKSEELKPQVIAQGVKNVKNEQEETQMVQEGERVALLRLEEEGQKYMQLALLTCAKLSAWDSAGQFPTHCGGADCSDPTEGIWLHIEKFHVYLLIQQSHFWAPIPKPQRQAFRVSH
jgi:hypothetical protein